MAQKTVRIGVEIDRESDADFQKWADNEGRSKRRHAEILMRRLIEIFNSKPTELERLGLASPVSGRQVAR